MNLKKTLTTTLVAVMPFVYACGANEKNPEQIPTAPAVENAKIIQEESEQKPVLGATYEDLIREVFEKGAVTEKSYASLHHLKIDVVLSETEYDIQRQKLTTHLNLYDKGDRASKYWDLDEEDNIVIQIFGGATPTDTLRVSDYDTLTNDFGKNDEVKDFIPIAQQIKKYEFGKTDDPATAERLRQLAIDAVLRAMDSGEEFY